MCFPDLLTQKTFRKAKGEDSNMAEVAGFEPVRPLRAYTLSKRAP